MSELRDSPSTIPLTFAQREARLLAPFAMHSTMSCGRKYDEPEHAYRGPFQRDRDRVLHSAAYRRLSGKMQVFTGEMGDYHRTRLTHTQEVASIARTIGRALRLNEDLIEALALLHDIGHPPFGHAGEDALDQCLADLGGFSHNQYALTIAEELEDRYQPFPGLNLTREVLEGQAARASKGRPSDIGPLLEVQVVDVADSITYDAHDTDDAVKLGLLTLEELSEIPLIRETIDGVRRQFGPLDDEHLRKAVVHNLIDWQVSDVLENSAAQLGGNRFATADEARSSSFRVGPGGDLAAKKKELESVLYNQVYRHPRLTAVRHQAQDRLKQMFDGYVKNPQWLPRRFFERAEAVGIRRAVADYLAGMTDRFCDQQFHRHFTADR